MIQVSVKGTDKTSKYLKRALKFNPNSILSKYAEEGLAALIASTPADTGNTASQWSYDISYGGGVYSITWSNSNINRGINIALILDTGHGTGTGGYVQGRNYIHPAMQPIFDKIADSAWEEVTNA